MFCVFVVLFFTILTTLSNNNLKGQRVMKMFVEERTKNSLQLFCSFYEEYILIFVLIRYFVNLFQKSKYE